MTDPRYQDARPDHAAPLARMAAACFTETFGTLYPPRDLAAFLAKTFSESAFAAAIADPATPIRVAFAGDALVGFCKLGPRDIPVEVAEPAIELRQLYVLKDWQGAGIAPVLTDWAIATARAMERARLVLSVYVDNHRARRFYERYGFVDVGRYDFRVGEQIDEDRVMVLEL